MKTIKSFYLNIALLSLFSIILTSVFGQPGYGYRYKQQNREKMQAQKVAFITDRLDLSSEEAEKFWPIYNQYTDDLKKERDNYRDNHKVMIDDIKDLNDDEAIKQTQAYLDHEINMLNLEKKMLTELKGVLSPQKILMLVEVEKEFRIELMRHISRGYGRGPGGGNGYGYGRSNN